jgi:hypothetical protein
MKTRLIALPLLLLANLAQAADKPVTPAPAGPAVQKPAQTAPSQPAAAAKPAPVQATSASKEAPAATASAQVTESAPKPGEARQVKTKSKKHYRKPRHLPKGDLRQCLDEKTDAAIIRCAETKKKN